MGLHVRVIGVGNEYRRDDGVGIRLARTLAARPRSKVEILEGSGEGAALMDRFAGADAVLVLDAMVSGAAPGTVRRVDAHRESMPQDLLHNSTHDFGVAQAVEMARILGRLPPRLVVYGIEGASFDHGEYLTPELERALPEVLRRIEAELDALGAG